MIKQVTMELAQKEGSPSVHLILITDSNPIFLVRYRLQNRRHKIYSVYKIIFITYGGRGFND